MYNQQRKWEKAQDQKATEAHQQNQNTAQATKQLSAARKEFSAEKVGRGLDFDTVREMGAQYLTKGDRQNITDAGEDAAREGYRICLRRIIKSGTEAEVKTIKQRLAVHKKAQNAKPNEGGPNKKKETPSQEQVLTRETAQIADVFGLDD